MKNTHIKSIFAISTIAASVLTGVQAQAANYKHVAVPPAQMAQQKLADATSKGIFSHSTMLPITVADLKSFEKSITLDGDKNSPIVLLAPNADKLSLKITNPMGQVVYDERKSSKAVNQIKMGSQSFTGKEFAINNPMKGQWKVSLDVKSPIRGKAATDVIGYLAFKGDSSFQAFSFLDNNFTTKGSDINAVAYMADVTEQRGNRSQMLRQDPALSAIDSAFALVKSPSGKQYRIALNDQGINGDKIAGDGKYSAKMPSDEIGVYTKQIQINGQHANGKQFSRTTTDIYPIAEKTFEFANKPAQIKQAGGSLDNTKAILSVPVNQLADSHNVHLSAEIWGTDDNGQMRSAAWVGGIVEPNKAGNLELNFDTRWLSREGLKAPYQLKSVRLQTNEGNIPLALAPEMEAKGSIKPTRFNSVKSDAITQDMLMGKAPATSKTDTRSATGSKLLLVHGYCSGQAWLTGHFYDAAEFKDYNQNISHATFAQRVKNFGASYNSYGIVAHSQGGAASLELYAKHWSGLDNASSGALIQSVGTPYQGTALAGNLAALGDVFGAGCGKNTDLTYSGASNWLATIPTWARAKVNYYTTSFETKWWRYDYCHLATDLFLDDPEDGTTEKWSGQLSGAVNKGHKTGQCHTSSMRDPSQTKDTGRNSTMSSAAAR